MAEKPTAHQSRLTAAVFHRPLTRLMWKATWWSIRTPELFTPASFRHRQLMSSTSHLLRTAAALGTLPRLIRVRRERPRAGSFRLWLSIAVAISTSYLPAPIPLALHTF